MIVALDADDDFVRTISDNEPDLPLLDEEVEVESENEPSIGKTSQKKRKRDNGDESAVIGSGKKKGKKLKVQEGNAVGGSGDGEGGPLEAEDDVMDSEFEFVVGDGGGLVEEGFDGWGDEDVGGRTGAQGGKAKREVDIDDLIKRRRGKLGGEKEVNVEGEIEGDSSDFGCDDEEEEEREEGEENEMEVEDEDEDENLAEDAFGMGADIDEEEDDEEGRTKFQEGDGSEDEEEDEEVADAMPEPEDLEDVSEDEEDPEELAKREAFFAPEDKSAKSSAKENLMSKAFQSMNLSRPILRGLASVGFTDPTPIQRKTIPVALLAKDVVGGAVTGSGKTGAFIIPILERLLHRPKKVPTSRVAILLPTRELAVQCFNVAKKLASFTDISFALLTGGFSLREQESVLRTRPDVIIATPGRFIDHMRNSASFTVDTLEILVLDEADRMLEDGFADELNEILSTIPRSRQTMLFSATMTDKVDKLIRVGLDKPVRLMVDARKQTVTTLTQEFVRLRPGREDKRLGYLTYLCTSVFTERVIVFFRQKKEAHRVRVIFGLLGIKATELHGSMSQEQVSLLCRSLLIHSCKLANALPQRISSLTSFRNTHATHLLATDLASRGLDVPNVSVVLNYEAPQSHEIYLHRVGRTARAGRGGRACTIAGEPDRKIVKQAVKGAKAQGAKIVSRIVDPAVADEWAAKVDALESEVEAILKEEKEEKLLNQTDMQIRKGENLVDYEEEIKARPRRTWFESEKEKLEAKKAGREELNGAVGLGKVAKKGRKLSNKDKKALDDKRERVEGRVWKKGKGEAKAAEKGRGKGKKQRGGNGLKIGVMGKGGKRPRK